MTTARRKAEPGDRVRITIEGLTNTGFGEITPGGRIVILPEDVVTVEVIEPKWRSCDVIACKHGHTYIRTHEATWLNSDGFRAEGPCITKTATLLVRNGQIVLP